jgi:hypothetical protein
LKDGKDSTVDFENEIEKVEREIRQMEVLAVEEAANCENEKRYAIDSWEQLLRRSRRLYLQIAVSDGLQDEALGCDLAGGWDDYVAAMEDYMEGFVLELAEQHPIVGIIEPPTEEDGELKYCVKRKGLDEEFVIFQGDVVYEIEKDTLEEMMEGYVGRQEPGKGV